MTSEQVAEVIVKALRRDASDVHAPWRWAAIVPVARAVPASIAWLYAKTGAHRPEAVDHKRSLSALHDAFREAPTPELARLVGSHEAEFVGPAWLRLPGPLTMRLTGMPGWCGKRFRAPADGGDSLEGKNLLRRHGRLEESIPMRAEVAPSRVDGRLALVVSYPPDARRPWRNVNDELRPLDDHTLLGLTFGIPGAPRGGSPFLLHRMEATK
jgi:hypothetical protein